MKVEVNIERGHIIAIFIGLFLLSGVLIVYAYNPKGSANPAVFGHSVNEVFGAQFDILSDPCGVGKAITRIYNNGSIACTTMTGNIVQLIAGTGIRLSPTNGMGTVTISGVSASGVANGGYIRAYNDGSIGQCLEKWGSAISTKGVPGQIGATCACPSGYKTLNFEEKNPFGPTQKINSLCISN